MLAPLLQVIVSLLPLWPLLFCTCYFTPDLSPMAGDVCFRQAFVGWGVVEHACRPRNG